MTAAAEPPRVRRLTWPWGPDTVLVRCPECGTYTPATDAQLAGEAPVACVVRWCGWSEQRDWRAEVPPAA